MNLQTTATESHEQEILPSNLQIDPDACHELFCIFGDSYLSGTQDAEVTKSLSWYIYLLRILKYWKDQKVPTKLLLQIEFLKLVSENLIHRLLGRAGEGEYRSLLSLWMAWLPQTPSVSQSMDDRVRSNRIFMPHFQILSHSFKRPPHKKICNSKRHL